jgi:hypothetical protein
MNLEKATLLSFTSFAPLIHHGQPDRDSRLEGEAFNTALVQGRCAVVVYRALLTACIRHRRRGTASNTVLLKSRHQLHAHPTLQSLQCVLTCLVAELLPLSKRNSNAAEIIIFLHRLTQVLIEYFKELEEESIRDNFVIIYELMDEMMDFGFPQTTESKILQECV